MGLLTEILSGDDKTAPKGYKPSTPKERENWNGFLVHLKNLGLYGSKDLDVKDQSLGMKHLEEYNKNFPDKAVSPEFIPTAQYEAELIRKKGKFPGLTDEQSAELHTKYLPQKYKDQQISGVDGWLGSLTSQQGYPLFITHGDTYGKPINYGTSFEDFVNKDKPEVQAKYSGDLTKILSMKN